VVVVVAGGNFVVTVVGARDETMIKSGKGTGSKSVRIITIVKITYHAHLDLLTFLF